ncbi:hypothetical protein KGP24_24250 (plasmid) [Enterobacter sp. JBIWA008]|uniref:hypothetical protein n=1 Tax=Enterobacter TaxID=547 RepID=UPI001CBAEDDD|nr:MULTISPECIES: hypothetical protein [Enterobacter]MCE2003913.1 hypothetical protein [Enterobacter asburiae]UAN38706.1 hypothetical protein KGP18_22500 [Enterobacter asburiae]UAN43476.1 hypothetical protein KGP24_24250 [Enterobacter sp. JBIWA008]
MYPGIENVWGALTGTFKHKHLWLDYRIWPSKYQTNLRATNFPGQPVIVTGPGLTIAEWLPGYNCWFLADLSQTARTAFHEQSDEIYLCPPSDTYLDHNSIYSGLIFMGL